MDICVEATYGAAKKFAAAGLDGFNRQHLSGHVPKSFAVTANSDGAARGGLIAEGLGAWMHISILWVEDSFRRRGIGAKLLKAAEIEAKRRGATGVLVDTFSFQAPGFYKKLGYSSYGQVDDCPEAGMIWHRFKKTF